MADSLSSGWTGLIKAGFGLRLEVFVDFGIEGDYCFAHETVNTKFCELKSFLARPPHCHRGQIVRQWLSIVVRRRLI